MQRILLSGMGTLFVLLFALTLGYANSLRYPLLYPQLLFGVIGVLFYLLAVRDARAREGHQAANTAAQGIGDAAVAAGGSTPSASGYPVGVLRFLTTAALAVLYVATWEWAGYFLDTFLFTAALLIVLGERRLVIIAGLPALLTVMVYVVFFRLLYLPLPLGPLEGLLR